MAELYNAFREDLSKSSRWGKAGLIGSGVVLGAHQIGMEALLGLSAGETLEAVHNPVLAPFAVALVMGGVSRAVEECVTHITSSGVNRFPEMSEVLADRKKLDQEQEARLNSSNQASSRRQRASEMIQRTSVLIGLGSAGGILREHGMAPDRTYDDNIETGRKSAGFLMKFNAGLGFILAGGAKLLDQTGLNASENIAAVATSPKTWGGFFIFGRTLGYIDHRKKVKARKSKPKSE